MTNRVTILLDESGSMSGQQDRVVGGINKFMEELNGKARIKVALFEHSSYRVHFDGKLKDWTPMKPEDHRPGGGTPLYDSIARAINETAAKDGDKVVVIIDTDGMENMSTEHTQASVKALIEKKKKDGWEFMFFGSGDTDTAGAHVAIQGVHLGTRTTSSSHLGRRTAYVSLANSTANYFSGGEFEDENPTP